MSENTNKKNYKQFSITTISDALIALGSLISASISNLEKFDEYTTEAMMLLEERHDSDLVDAKTYDDINDKSLFRQRELLALMADEANDIFSYRCQPAAHHVVEHILHMSGRFFFRFAIVNTTIIMPAWTKT